MEERSITAERAGLWFVGTWLAGSVVGSIGLAIVHRDTEVDAPIGALAVSLILLWTTYVVGMWQASVRDGSGSFVVDHLADTEGRVVRPVDLVGVPLGFLCQFAMVPVLYLPLEAIWPDTFTQERLEENARDLVDRADGGALALLVVLVAVGAPLVEELFFRGLLQRPLLRSGAPVALIVVLVAAVFALIHFRPVEYVGLFGFGLVLGAVAWRTGRLAMPVLAHVAFNAAGLAAVS